jgi:hypothetical protein
MHRNEIILEEDVVIYGIPCKAGTGVRFENDDGSISDAVLSEDAVILGVPLLASTYVRIHKGKVICGTVSKKFDLQLKPSTISLEANCRFHRSYRETIIWAKKLRFSIRETDYYSYRLDFRVKASQMHLYEDPYFISHYSEFEETSAERISTLIKNAHKVWIILHLLRIPSDAGDDWYYANINEEVRREVLIKFSNNIFDIALARKIKPTAEQAA